MQQRIAPVQPTQTRPPLQVLRLENNRLESLPDALGELPALVKLHVSNNCLRALPAAMGRLRRIQRIDAANNMLARVPSSFGHLRTIKELNLRYNSLDDRYKAKAEEGLSRCAAALRCCGGDAFLGMSGSQASHADEPRQ